MQRHLLVALCAILVGCASTRGSDKSDSSSAPHILEEAIAGYMEENPCAGKVSAAADQCRTEVAKRLLTLADDQFERAAASLHSKAGFRARMLSPKTTTGLESLSQKFCV